MTTCHIVAAGDFFPERFAPRAGDGVYAADAGLRHLDALGAAPDMIFGDFDSLGAPPERENVRVCPVRKNDTDTMVALKYALERGYNRILLHGGTGGERFDHTLANLQALVYAARRGAQAFLLGENFTATALCGGALRFAGYAGNLTVLCVGETAVGVGETGVSYPLRNAVLTPDFPLGVSNSFEGERAEISLERGDLLLCWQGNLTRPLPEMTRPDKSGHERTE
jgi:thiamine pyrophosphokinase